MRRPISSMSPSSRPAAGRLGRAVGRLDLRPAAEARGRGPPRHLAVGGEPRHRRDDDERRRRRRADGGDHQRRLRRWPRPVRMRSARAGPERSVAATKTFVSSVLAAWRSSPSGARTRRSTAVAALPGQFEKALACDWTPLGGPAGAGELGLRPRARPVVRDRQRGGAEVQGDLRHPRRELLGGRGAARAGGDRAGALPGAGASRSTTRRRARWWRRPSGWPGRGPTSS